MRSLHCVLVLALGLAACAPHAPRLDLKAKWYLVEPPGSRDQDWPNFHLYLAIVNWGDPLFVDRMAFLGIGSYPGSEQAWSKGVVREYDLGPFRCAFPTRVRVCMGAQWRDAGVIEGRMPSSLPANPEDCPGYVIQKSKSSEPDAPGPVAPNSKECPDEIGLRP